MAVYFLAKITNSYPEIASNFAGLTSQYLGSAKAVLLNPFVLKDTVSLETIKRLKRLGEMRTDFRNRICFFPVADLTDPTEPAASPDPKTQTPNP